MHVPLLDGTVRVYCRSHRRPQREPHLHGDLRLLAECFPYGVDREQYLLLLAALYEEYSNGCLAALMEAFTGRDYYGVLNDIP